MYACVCICIVRISYLVPRNSWASRTPARFRLPRKRDESLGVIVQTNHQRSVEYRTHIPVDSLSLSLYPTSARGDLHVNVIACDPDAISQTYFILKYPYNDTTSVLTVLVYFRVEIRNQC